MYWTVLGPRQRLGAGEDPLQTVPPRAGLVELWGGAAPRHKAVALPGGSCRLETPTHEIATMWVEPGKTRRAGLQEDLELTPPQCAWKMGHEVKDYSQALRFSILGLEM